MVSKAKPLSKYAISRVSGMLKGLHCDSPFNNLIQLIYRVRFKLT